jgi:hypothetical protein
MRTKSKRKLLKKGIGFIILRILVVAAFICIGCFIVYQYYIYPYYLDQQQNALFCTNEVKADMVKSARSGIKIYTDPSGIYRVAYPSDWNILLSKASFYEQGSSPPNAATTSPGSPLDPTTPEFYDRQYPDSCRDDNEDSPTIKLDAYKSGDINKILFGYNVNTRTAKRLTINSYQALYVKQVMYYDDEVTWDSYFITHNNVTLVISFQENIRYNSSPESQIDNFDFSGYDPIYTAFVKSIRFLK